MGNWFNKTTWTLTDCSLVKDPTNFVYGEIGDNDFLFPLKVLEKCQNPYCKDAYYLLNQTRPDALALFRFGDTATPRKELPIISKSRLIFSDVKPIIWLLHTSRHYSDLESYHKTRKDGEDKPWSEKMSTLLWRGSSTGNRVKLITPWINYYDKSLIDVTFTKLVQINGFRRSYVEQHYYVQEQMTLAQMTRYKYLLSVEGNDVATDLKWKLYSTSVVFMAPPTCVTWAMEDLLVPFVHYIPLAHDLSNLLEMIQWAEKHDDVCEQISKRATEFIERLWISDQAKRDTEYLKKELATVYVNQFHDALSKCV
eukprot:scaffold92820_cov55-Attheya_sp.AAC.2